MKDYITYLKFDDNSISQLLNDIDCSIINKEKAVVSTPNLDVLRAAYKNQELRSFINNSKFVTIDGMPILWLAKIQKKKNFKHKISGSDLTPLVLSLANKRNKRILIFGGKEGVAERAKEQIEKDYPGIKKITTICPKFGYEENDDLCIDYINQINNSECDIVLMCTGSPKTELFMNNYYDHFNNCLYMLVGATVDFIAGNIKRAPKWMSNIGLEWLYRLSKDFKRLIKRYILDLFFLVKIILIIIFNRKIITKKINK